MTKRARSGPVDPLPGDDETKPDWQLLPPLTDDEFGALKADVAAHGVRVPVVVDAETGAVLDGHHRLRAVEEMRAEGTKVPDYPRQVVRFADDEERSSFVLAANLFRRHLTKAQRRELVADLRAKGWSLRAGSATPWASGRRPCTVTSALMHMEQCSSASSGRTAAPSRRNGRRRCS